MSQLVLPGRYENLAKIAEFVRRVAQEAGFGEFAIYEVETAVDEACSNIIEHAYGGENRGEIDITCKITSEGLIVILRDKGKPFNPANVRKVDPQAPLKRRRSSGLGLFFMHSMMDEVKFEIDPQDGNILTLTKRKEKTG